MIEWLGIKTVGTGFSGVLGGGWGGEHGEGNKECEYILEK